MEEIEEYRLSHAESTKKWGPKDNKNTVPRPSEESSIITHWEKCCSCGFPPEVKGFMQKDDEDPDLTRKRGEKANYANNRERERFHFIFANHLWTELFLASILGQEK